MTAGNTPALTAEEWLSGIDKGQQVLENLNIFKKKKKKTTLDSTLMAIMLSNISIYDGAIVFQAR